MDNMSDRGSDRERVTEKGSRVRSGGECNKHLEGVGKYVGYGC